MIVGIVGAIAAMRWRGKKADAAYLEVVMRGAKDQIELLTHHVNMLEQRIDQLNAALDASELRILSAEMAKEAATRGALSFGGMPVPSVVVRVDNKGKPIEMIYFNESYAKIFGVTREDLYEDIDEVHEHVTWKEDYEWMIRKAYAEDREQIGTVEFSVDNITHRILVVAWPIRINGSVNMIALLGIPAKE